MLNYCVWTMVFLGKYINTIIMKKIRNLIACIFFMLFAASFVFVNAEESSSLMQIRKGTFVKVVVPIEFSTLSADVGDELFFINTQDYYYFLFNY